MLIKIRPDGIDLPLSSEITPRAVFESRRDFIRQLAVGSIAGTSLYEMANREAFAQTPGAQKLAAGANPAYALMSEKKTPYKDATTYNNFYEFGTDKSEPAQNSGTLKTRPWTVTIDGEVKKPMTLDIDSLMKLAPLEERIYRLRCVEGWSMVIPWIGYSLSNLIKNVEPTSNARYVEFITLDDKNKCPAYVALYWSGRMSKDCVWTKRITRWHYSRLVCMVKSCQIKTAHQCGSLCLGNMALNRRSRSSKFVF